MKRDPRLSLFAQAAFSALAACMVILTVAAFTISGTVRDLDGRGVGGALVTLYNGSSGEALDAMNAWDGGGFAFYGLEDGDYGLQASSGGFNDYIPKQIFGSDITGITVTLPFHGKKSTPTPTPTPAAHSGGSSGGHPASGNVEYAQTTYNMYPIVQINTSWKRASKLEPITFDSGSSYDPDGYIVAYEWYFGDGSMTEGKVVQHAYQQEGTYTVRLRVVDNGGAERSAYVVAIISNKPPVAVPGNDTNATVGEVVRFNGSGSYDPDGTVVIYEWSFGDGASAQGPAATHAYGRPDKYKVELKVTDDSGANSTAYRTVTVTGETTAPAPAKTGGFPGILLLAGTGVACVALIALARRKR